MLANLLCLSALAADPAMAQRTQACTACHGAQGRAGPDGYYPRLAGKPAGYLYNQLRNFKEGRRHYTLMEGLLAPLSDDYLHDMAEYFASLSPPYPRPLPSSASPTELARGRTLALQGDAGLQLPACVQCHGLSLTGVMPATPGLLGLPRDYLNAQLGGWQTGQRRAHSPDCMAEVARKLSPQDANAVALWLAAQPVPDPSHAAAARPARTPGLLPLPLCGSAP
jgi:cytochrome c553